MQLLVWQKSPIGFKVIVNKPVYEDESDRTLQDILSGIRVSDPEELVISREEFNDIELKMNEILSDLEWQVLTAYLDETELSMQATSMREFVRSLIECPDGQSFLPVAAVYGLNAGGKSNLLEALDYIRSAVARPIRLLSASTDAPEGNRSSIPLP